MSSNTTEHGEHFNESIVNEVILEDMKKNRIDHMKYLPGMETMEESDVMEQVITAMNAYDYDKYTESVAATKRMAFPKSGTYKGSNQMVRADERIEVNAWTRKNY